MRAVATALAGVFPRGLERGRNRGAALLPALLVFACCTSASRAQLLWPGTSAGMSLEEVKRSFPEAHAPVTPAVLENGKGEQLLEWDQTVIAGHPFRVLFFFKDERLVQVALVDHGEIPNRELDKFRTLLRGKYGLEYSTRSSEYIQVRWNAVRTVILLTWKPEGHGIATLSISYEAPITDDANRL